MIEVICEIGVNHNGSLSTACRMVDYALYAKCDAVKTQLWNTERVYPRDRWDEMKRLELNREEIASLKDYCDSHYIELIVTPDEFEDAVFLRDLGVKRMKMSSQDITNRKFIKQIASLNIPTIMSTGACTQEEMDKAVVVFWGHTSAELHVLHCVSAYPAPWTDYNLRVLRYMHKVYGQRIGLSDHTIGNEVAKLALAAGAIIFEKHMTLDRMQDGPDHKASCTPDEMKTYVNALKSTDLIMGDGIKRVMSSELENRKRYEEFIAPRR